MEARIRDATATDGIAIRDVHLASIEGLAGDHYSDEQVAAWAHERDPADYPVESPETEAVVAERGDRLVGFGWMKPNADGYLQAAVDGEITAVYVHPSVARDGVGTLMYEELEARARRADVDSLGLWASLNAVAFYESHGYSRVTDHTIEFHDGVTGTVVELRKSPLE